MISQSGFVVNRVVNCLRYAYYLHLSAYIMSFSA